MYVMLCTMFQRSIDTKRFPDVGIPYWHLPDFAKGADQRKSSIPAILESISPYRGICSLYRPPERYLCMQTRELGDWERQPTGSGMLPSQFGMRASIVRFALF